MTHRIIVDQSILRKLYNAVPQNMNLQGTLIHPYTSMNYLKQMYIRSLFEQYHISPNDIGNNRFFRISFFRKTLFYDLNMTRKVIRSAHLVFDGFGRVLTDCSGSATIYVNRKQYAMYMFKQLMENAPNYYWYELSIPRIKYPPL